jgi:flagellar biosynthesis protein FlhF
VVTRLKAQGVRGHLLERLAAAAADPSGVADPVAALTDCLQTLGLTGGAAAAGGQRLLAVVGGPGAGKTTALMKLAAHAQRVLGRATAVATLDAFGLGAAAAWQIFGAVSGIPVAAVGGGRQLKDLLADWKGYDLVLIDTPGIGAADAERLAWVESQLEGLRSLELHLALPADRREEDLHRGHQQLRRLPLRQALVTRLDETRSLGDLLHHLVNLKLPLSYFSSGQQIPQDLAPATVAALVRRLLDRDPAPEAVSAPAAAGEGGPFLANRSSDIFHRPDCRWTAMISPGNRVEFATLAAALGQRFKPCRYCLPGAAAAEHWNDDAPQARAACGG